MRIGGIRKRSTRSRVKLVLVSLIALSVIVSATVRSVYGLYSSQTQNSGSISSGTLTLENTNALGNSASTTLSAKVGVTTLNGAISAAVTSITVSANTTFPGSGNYTIIVDNEEMTVTAGQGTNSWTVTRGVNGTQAASHSSGANVYQASIGVAAFTGFPASGDYTIKVDSEKMMVTAGQGTAAWTVTRGGDGTTIASHALAAAVSEPACTTAGGSSNIIGSCDSVFTFSPAEEWYPGNTAVTNVTLKDSGSIAVRDLEVYMRGCLRGVTADAPWATSTPAAPSSSSPSTTGGFLFGGNTYYYEVTAVVSGNESVAGTEASYTPPIGTNTNQVTLTWAAVTGATSYNVYRSTAEGGEALLASGLGTTSYTDNTNTSPSGSPPSGTGSGNPCVTGNGGLYVQETNSTGTASQCWYPTTNTTCTFDGTIDLGLFATSFNTLGQSLDLGAGPTALGSRYFQIGLQIPSGTGNALQGTEALITLNWFGQA
ncbi:MAG: hypothetical protein ACRDLM_10345 [Gaiellaceae bacterium]